MPVKIVMLADSRSVHVRRWARSLVDRGIKLTLISLGGDDVEKVDLIKVPFSGNRRLDFLRRAEYVKNLINQIAPDVVHAHYTSSYGYWGMKSGFRPFLLSIWGTDIVEFPSNIISRTFLRRIINSATAISATSEYLRGVATKLMNNNRIPVYVIPFGVEIGPMETKKTNSDTVRLIYTKGHHKRYGPDILLKAFKALQGEYPSISLTLAGEGRMTSQLKKMAADLGIADKVEFTGFIDNNKIPETLAAHDIFVMPSLQEGFGVASLEASAAGLPTIATNVGGIPEVVVDGKTGLLVPPVDVKALADAVLRLSEDAGLRHDLGRNARAFVEERYDWNKNVDQMIDLYESLAHNSRS